MDSLHSQTIACIESTLERPMEVLRFFKRPVAFEFLKLPAELRIKIYQEVIHPASICTTLDIGTELDSGFDSLCYDTGRPSGVRQIRKYDVDGLHHLRLTCRLIRNELDHEIIKSVRTQVVEAFLDCDSLMDRTDRLQVLLDYPFWIGKISLKLAAEPRSLRHIQNLEMTAHLWDMQSQSMPEAPPTPHKDFIRALSPHVRSLTLNLVVPELVSNLLGRKAQEAIEDCIDVLAMRMWECLVEKACCACGLNVHTIPRTGVREIRINFPSALPYRSLKVWIIGAVSGDCGIAATYVGDGQGNVTGIVLFLNGGVRQCIEKEAKRKRQMLEKRWRVLHGIRRACERLIRVLTGRRM